jgi:hypothetical protein
MALTTVNDAIRLVDTGVYSIWGYPVPENIWQIEVGNDLYGDRMVRWKTKSDPTTVHKMDLSVTTEETILAVLAAMRLSC